MSDIDRPLMWKREKVAGMDPHLEVWRHLTKPLAAIRSKDHGRWHLSVSHQDRVPTWAELGEARDALLPADLHFMVPHPPRRYWLNYDRRVLHLWEMRDPELAEQFEWEGAEAQAAGYGAPTDGDES